MTEMTIRRLTRIQLVLLVLHPGLIAHRIASAIESTATAEWRGFSCNDPLCRAQRNGPSAPIQGGEGPTNVLTFVEEAGADIAICMQVAEEDAMVRGWDVNSELSYLCIHGCLHALGFDHR